MMKKSKIISLFLLFIFLNFDLKACSCGRDSCFEESYNFTKIILLGKVIEIKPFVSDSILFNKNYVYIKSIDCKIEVLSQFKGDKLKDTIHIITDFMKGMCGFPFREDSVYVIYADIEKRRNNSENKIEYVLTTNRCTRTKLFDFDEVNNLLRMAR